MKNKCKFLFLLTFMTLFLFYRVDSFVAMAAEQKVELTVVSGTVQNAESAGNSGTAQNTEFADDSGTVQSEESADDSKPGQNEESTDEPEPGQNEESTDNPEPGQNEESTDNPEPGQNEESTDEPKPGQNEESTDNPEPGQNEESVEEPEPGQNGETANDPESEQKEESIAEPGPKLTVKSIVKPTVESDSEQSVSTGSALIEWLESHKETGGTVKLTDNVVWDEDYSYCPNGIDRPSVFVDTDKYTITVTGEVELLSDGHLTFSGKPDGKGIFYVAEKGALAMQGVTVESEQCALWQEEGAGLVVDDDDCHISGSIHYADTPFVMYENSVCVVVEKGQTLNDVLPTQIYCAVNRQGQISSDEPVMLSWNPEGTETQQEERRRFELEGSYVNAASAEPVLCTVAYNDYPLTFTDVEASVSGSLYSFKGWYTKPEEDLPISVISEYSFDGETWFMYEERNVTSADDAFFIAFKTRQYDMTARSNIYIRLQWNDNGTRYFSDVLCYEADNLKYVEDAGGGRGGGTSIVNPPDEPQESIGDVTSKDEESIKNAHHNINADNAESEISSDTNQTETGDGEIGADTGAPNTDVEQPLYAGTSNTDAGQSLYAGVSDTDAGQPLYAESGTEEDVKQNMNRSDSHAAQKGEESAAALAQKEKESAVALTVKKEEPVTALAAYGENSANYSQVNKQASRSEVRQGSHIVIVIGFVLLSVIAGIAGFCVHSRSGTNR